MKCHTFEYWSSFKHISRTRSRVLSYYHLHEKKRQPTEEQHEEVWYQKYSCKHRKAIFGLMAQHEIKGILGLNNIFNILCSSQNRITWMRVLDLSMWERRWNQIRLDKTYHRHSWTPSREISTHFRALQPVRVVITLTQPHSTRNLEPVLSSMHLLLHHPVKSSSAM